MLPPMAYGDNPGNLVASRYVWSAICRVRSPMFAGKWLRDGIHLVTGSSSGDVSLWNPLTYTQELSFPGHESAIRAISISHDGNWIISADHGGQIKYWQTNLNLVHMLLAHSDPIRDICFCPTDAKFASCSDDGLIKVWDFERSKCDCTMQGHGTDVKCLDWHPSKGIILSGSKDCQQPIMLWDPRSASALCTIHIHKNAIMSIGWNNSGNLFASGSKDKTVKVFDIRSMKELQAFRGHRKEVYHISWHSVNDKFLASGGVDGSAFYWILGDEKEAGSIDNAHDGVIWEVSWHPDGHLFASMSNDQSAKIWMRAQPGDTMLDRYNLNMVPSANCEEEVDKLLPVAANRKKPSNPLNYRDQRVPGLDYSKFPPHTTNTNGLRPMLSEENLKMHFNQTIHRHFSCSFSKPQQSRAKRKDSYPIGKAPKPRIPSPEEVEMEEHYLFSTCPIEEHQEPIEYFDVYEEEEECPPAQFPLFSKNLNNINNSILMDIMELHKNSKFSHTVRHRLPPELILPYERPVRSRIPPQQLPPPLPLCDDNRPRGGRRRGGHHDLLDRHHHP